MKQCLKFDFVKLSHQYIEDMNDYYLNGLFLAYSLILVVEYPAELLDNGI